MSKAQSVKFHLTDGTVLEEKVTLNSLIEVLDNKDLKFLAVGYNLIYLPNLTRIEIVAKK